jgi:hypothetical protein
MVEPSPLGRDVVSLSFIQTLNFFTPFAQIISISFPEMGIG